MAADSKQIAFGSAYYGQETPNGLKVAYRLLMFLSALWMAAIEPRIQVSDHVAHLIDSWLAIGSIGIYFFCQYFGYKVPDNAPAPQAQEPNAVKA